MKYNLIKLVLEMGCFYMMSLSYMVLVCVVRGKRRLKLLLNVEK